MSITGPIAFPTKPGLKADTISLLDWGGPLKPQNGGAVQTLMRLGSRFQISFTLPPMLTEPYGRIWAARLMKAKLYGAIIPFGQDGFRIGTPGNFVVAGANQTGSTINLRGGTPYYGIREGQAFSLYSNGRHYLHMAASNVIASGTGTVSLDIYPMLRLIPADGDAASFGQPVIQGSLSGNDTKWTRTSAPMSDFGQIIITEDE
jgi:hypothetical protein